MIVMYILSLIVFGLLVGKIASFLVGEEKPGVLQDMALGLLGSLIGGFTARVLLGEGIVGFSLPSLAIGVLGSLIVISLVNMFTPHRV